MPITCRFCHEHKLQIMHHYGDVWISDIQKYRRDLNPQELRATYAYSYIAINEPRTTFHYSVIELTNIWHVENAKNPIRPHHNACTIVLDDELVDTVKSFHHAIKSLAGGRFNLARRFDEAAGFMNLSKTDLKTVLLAKVPNMSDEVRDVLIRECSD